MSFAFGALLRAGISAGLKPAEVWRLTPAELQVVVGPILGPAPLGRDRLKELQADFPDMQGE